jgi:hypothetical protein
MNLAKDREIKRIVVAHGEMSKNILSQNSIIIFNTYKLNRKIYTAYGILS